LDSEDRHSGSTDQVFKETLTKNAVKKSVIPAEKMFLQQSD
jgi:hypothetical protein